MNTIDVYASDFPHGTRVGFASGCKTKAMCANTGTDVQTCKEANMRYGRDWPYDQLIKEGLTELEADAKLRADAQPDTQSKPAAKKPRVVPKPSFSKAQLAATVTPVPDVDEKTGAPLAPTDTPLAAAAIVAGITGAAPTRNEALSAATVARLTGAALGLDPELIEERISELPISEEPAEGAAQDTPPAAAEASATGDQEALLNQVDQLEQALAGSERARAAHLQSIRDLERQLADAERRCDKNAERIEELDSVNKRLVFDREFFQSSQPKPTRPEPLPALVEPTAEATLLIDPTDAGGIRVALYGLGARDLGMTLVFAEHGLQDVDVQVGA